MPESEHTPWTKQTDTLGRTIISDSKGMLVAVVHISHKPGEQETRSNLLLAAPDLLKALGSIECRSCGKLIRDGSGHGCHGCAHARAAVDRAKGKT